MWIQFLKNLIGWHNIKIENNLEIYFWILSLFEGSQPSCMGNSTPPWMIESVGVKQEGHDWIIGSSRI